MQQNFTKQKLQQYLQQKRGFQQRKKQTSKTLTASMTALASLAAINLMPTDANAQLVQCAGPDSVNPVTATNATFLGGSYTGGSIFDLDGDGMGDFTFFKPAAAGGNWLFLLGLPASQQFGSFILNSPCSSTAANTRNGTDYLLDGLDVAFVVPLSDGGFGFFEIRGGCVTAWGTGAAAISDVTYADKCSQVCPDAPLPVELTNFIAKAKKASIQLQWETAVEIDNAGFELERSLDRKTYEVLKFIEGKGNTVEPSAYQFGDEQVKTGQTYYYRLKQIDFSGRFEYSEIISAQLQGVNPSTKIAPNPTSDVVRMEYNTPSNAPLYITTFDVAGKLLNSQKYQVVEGDNNLNLNLSKLGTGTFFLKLEQEGLTSYERVVVK